MRQWANWEAVFSTESVRQLRDATIEELLAGVYSVRSVPRCYKQDKFKIELVVTESPASEDVKTGVEGCTALKAVTRQRLVKTQQTENT
jgi:hypothetical protein